jgi:hypothetical protein
LPPPPPPPDIPSRINPIIAKHLAFWKGGALLSKLQGTWWLVMERTDAVRNPLIENGISVSAFCFHRVENDYLTCEMYSKFYTPGNSHDFSYFTGLATSNDGQQYMHIEMHRQEADSANPGYGVFDLRIANDNAQYLMIGLYSYF